MEPNNDFSDLLNYLERYNRGAPVKTSPPQVKPKKVDPKPKPKVEEPTDKRKALSEESARILKECMVEDNKSYHSEVQVFKDSKSSGGFDVRKFEALMRAKLVDDHKRMQSYERPYVSVTELYQCMRKNYYARMKYQIDVKSQYRFSYLYLINKVGDLVHDIFQTIYDFSETEKTVVSEKFKVKGRVDALREGNLYEFKTIDPEKFKNKYVPEHYIQGLIYSYILNTEYNYNIDQITIVYILRNLKKVIPYDLPYDPDLAKTYLKHATLLHKAITSQSVPEPVNSTDTQCKYCPYIDYCKQDSCDGSKPFMKAKKKDDGYTYSKPKSGFSL